MPTCSRSWCKDHKDWSLATISCSKYQFIVKFYLIWPCFWHTTVWCQYVLLLLTANCFLNQELVAQLIFIEFPSWFLRWSIRQIATPLFLSQPKFGDLSPSLLPGRLRVQANSDSSSLEFPGIFSSSAARCLLPYYLQQVNTELFQYIVYFWTNISTIYTSVSQK